MSDSRKVFSEKELDGIVGGADGFPWVGETFKNGDPVPKPIEWDDFSPYWQSLNPGADIDTMRSEAQQQLRSENRNRIMNWRLANGMEPFG
jgi:hypothetical protein